jgi:hypothetical protein
MTSSKRTGSLFTFRTQKWAIPILLIFLVPIGLLSADPPAAKTYPTPLAAADALFTAGAQNDLAALEAALGPGADRVLSSGDAVADKDQRAAFLKAALEKTTLVSMSDTTVFLLVGADDWPFPIPLVKGSAGWRWDTVVGKEEILARRIGRNELTTIGLCQAFVQAQREFARSNPDSSGLGTYADRFFSSPGKHDGLYWPAKDGEPASPLGPFAATAAHEGYTAPDAASGPKPYHGYFFRILKSQGKDSPGGAKDYVKDGRMTGGFALVAWPAQYGNSGIMTFLVNQTGIVFQKNLGARTAELGKAMTQFNPDSTWSVTK